ncbi:YT521-B-like domain-containing protein [Lasiosphaeris hirsuta]|uniref:YT521-B-like domain-containing protein n=1 Tax=Lasiosphaeris hirsuta TaxID=260670 RepID=A0AA40DQF5_9PEZI|nr:YT521-B-like domain-containing protein [Lasiosphaeris hirsuta]
MWPWNGPNGAGPDDLFLSNGHLPFEYQNGYPTLEPAFASFDTYDPRQPIQHFQPVQPVQPVQHLQHIQQFQPFQHLEDDQPPLTGWNGESSAPNNSSGGHSLIGMSSSANTTKLGLDARAAELKEKLLRNRSSRSQARTSTAEIASESTNTQSSDPVRNVPASSTSGAPTPNMMKPSTSAQFVPHAVPRKPSQMSVPADANDIADLITSISSNHNASNHKTGSNNPAQPGDSAANIQIKQQVKQHGKQQVKPTNLNTNNSPNETTLPTPISPPLTNPIQALMVPKQQYQQETKAPTQPLPRPFRMPMHRDKTGSTEEGEVKIESTKREALVLSDRSTIPAQNQASAPTGNIPDTTAKDVAPSTSLQKPVNGQQTTAVDQMMNGAAQDANRLGSGSGPTASSTALARLTETDPDLKDWLVLTNYYNVESRNRKLERHRKGLALAAEKERIEAEQRKLIEEEEIESMGFRRSTMGQVTGAVSSATPMGNIVATSLASNPKPHHQESRKPTLTKREFDDEEDVPARVDKAARVEGLELQSRNIETRSGRERDDHQESLSDHRFKRSGSRLASRSRDPSPRRYPHPPSSPRRNYRRSPPPRPRGYSPHRPPPESHRRSDYNEYDDHGRRNNEPRGELAQRDAGQYGHPKHINPSKQGDTRFFIVKSFNEENVYACMEDGVWVTQAQNGEVLASAFAECKDVILFFSINKSRAFQGYARMSSAPSPETSRPRWMSGINWNTSDPFRVQWLSKTSVEFRHVGHLKNSFNEHMPVLVGKDGQEIEEGCGHALAREMKAFAEDNDDRFHDTYRGRARGEYGGRRDSDVRSPSCNGRYIKREEGVDGGRDRGRERERGKGRW